MSAVGVELETWIELIEGNGWIWEIVVRKRQVTTEIIFS